MSSQNSAKLTLSFPSLSACTHSLSMTSCFSVLSSSQSTSLPFRPSQSS